MKADLPADVADAGRGRRRGGRGTESGRVSHPLPPDAGARELARQMRALPAPQYEVAVFNGRMVRRVWRARQALKSLGWLRDRNAAGGHVYFRPATTACVLVDDVTGAALAAVAADGLAPAAVVETKPENFQAWFRVGRDLEPQLAICVGQVLAVRCGGDPAGVDLRRLGRAAGFTNRTAALADGDRNYPLVRLVEARGRVTPGADELLAEAEERLRRKESRRAAAAARMARSGPARSAARDPAAFLAREIARIARRHGAATDMGRAAATAARRMALCGFSRADVAAALEACPEARRRQDGNAADYVRRTVAWAFGGKVRRPR